MNKMKKILVLVIIINILFIIDNKVMAITGNNGSDGSNAGAGEGTWQKDGTHGYGLRVTIINKNTGNRVSGTKSVNYVRNLTWNSKKIYTSKQSHSKIHYLLSSDKRLDLGKYSYNLVHDTGVPDFTKGTLDADLKANNYKLLTKYVTNGKTGYTCWNNNPDMDQCKNANDHIIVVEPLTVQGTLNTRYDWLTPYEFAVKLTNNQNLVGVFTALSNGLYSKTGYKITYLDGKTEKTVEFVGVKSKCSDKCEGKLKGKNLYGVGVYTDPVKRFDKIKVKKTWTGGNNSCTKKTSFTVKYKKNNKWNDVQTFNIENNGSYEVAVQHVKNRQYKVIENTAKTKISSCSGYKVKYGVTQSKTFKLNAGETKTVTFQNKLEKDTVVEKKGKIVVDVYKFKTQFKTLNNIGDSEPESGYFWQRVYGGKRLTQNEKNYTSTDNANKIPIYIGIIAEKNGSNTHTNVYGPFQDEITRSYLYQNTYIDLKKCKTIGNYIWDSDSWPCYKLCYKTEGERSCYLGKVNNTVNDPTNFLGNDEPFYKDFHRLNSGIETQKQVAVTVVPVDKTKEIIGPVETDDNGRVVFDNLSANVAYNIKIECKECGDNNTYSRIRREDTAFVAGKTSKGFTLKENETMSVKFFNNNITSCQTELDRINNSDSNLSQQLLDLYESEKKENRNYLKLLNFKVNDTDKKIKYYIKNKTIACEETLTSDIKSNATATCDDNEKKLIYSDPNNMLVADYIDKNGYSKSLATKLFNLENNENGYCFVNFTWSFKEQNVIKNNTKLNNTSWLWPSGTKNQVGELIANINCIGNLRNVDDLKTDYITNVFKNINVNYNGKTLQSLILSRDIDYDIRSEEIDYEDPDSSINSAVEEESVSDLESNIELNKLLDENKCGNNELYYENACYSSKDNNIFNCPPGYTLNDNDHKCYKGGIPLQVDGCYESQMYVGNVCLSEQAEVSCPSGYSLGDDNRCYENDEQIFDEEVGDFKYNVTVKFPIVYKNYGFGDYLSGTVSYSSSQSRLGWGVPLPLDSLSGNVELNYTFDDKNDIYRLFEEANIMNYFDEKNVFNHGFKYQCNYTKNSVDISAGIGKSRFVDISNPFPGKSGNGRAYGSNWNSCYVSLSQRLGKESNISCYDLYGKNNSTKCPNGDTYCMYGDTNCDGKYDATDVFIYNQIYKSISNTTTISISQNVYHKQLLDLDQNGKINGIDVRLYFTWYNYTYGSGQSTDIQGNKHNINFKDKTTYVEYDAAKTDSFSSCDSYIDQIIKNIDKSSNSTKEPMYSFTLSSKDLQNIRSYVKNTSTTYMNTDNLECDSSGFCKSKFITDLLSSFAVDNGLSLSGIDGQCKNRVQLNFRNGKITTNYCDY